MKMRYQKYILASLFIFGIYATFPIVFMDGESDLVIYEDRWPRYEEIVGKWRSLMGTGLFGVLDKRDAGQPLDNAEKELVAFYDGIRPDVDEVYHDRSNWMHPIRYIPVKRNEYLECQRRNVVHDMYSWMEAINYTSSKFIYWIVVSLCWVGWIVYLSIHLIRVRRLHGGHGKT